MQVLLECGRKESCLHCGVGPAKERKGMRWMCNGNILELGAQTGRGVSTLRTPTHWQCQAWLTCACTNMKRSHEHGTMSVPHSSSNKIIKAQRVKTSG